MSNKSENIFLSRKEKQLCSNCHHPIAKGQKFVAESEKSKGICFKCSPFIGYTFLPSGDAAMTRRSKKHSTYCGVVKEWNQKRRRYERKGQYVELKAINLAKQECDADKHIRQTKNAKAAIARQVKDEAYIKAFAIAINQRYPNSPKNKAQQIAQHACEKHSGRVGRTANAKIFDPKMIDLAVEAHIRHTETNYDSQFGKGKTKREIRADLKFKIQTVMQKWKKK